MKFIASLIAFMLPVSLFAQISELQGKWKEYARLGLDSNAKNFADTVRIEFYPGKKYSWMRQGGLIYKGSYTIEWPEILFSVVTYEIAAYSDTLLVLRDVEGIHSFRPHQSPNRNSLVPDSASVPVTSISQMRGDWKVFKRTNASPLPEVNYALLIQSAKISETPDTAGNFGHLSAVEPNGTRHRWQIKRFENGKIFTYGDSERSFDVIKAEKELILQEGDIKYYFKQFK